MKKCFIIDDERMAREGLKEYIHQTPNLVFVGESNNPVEALPDLSSSNPDILFLDINMPMMNGIDFVKNFSPKMSIIYTTAHQGHALEAYDMGVEDYLLKPIQYERFLKAIARVYKQNEESQLKHISSNQEANSFFVKADGLLKRILIDEVLYLKSIQNYVKIHLVNGSEIVYRTLKSFEDQLPAHQFIKVQKSYIVNLQKVRSFDGYLLQFDQQTVPVSRNLVKDIKSALISSTIFV